MIPRITARLVQKVSGAIKMKPMYFPVRVNGEYERMPAVSLDSCEYIKERRVLKLSSKFMGMPREFFVVSHVTGRTVKFSVVGSDDPLFDQDQWDGEQQVYRLSLIHI